MIVWQCPKIFLKINTFLDEGLDVLWVAFKTFIQFCNSSVELHQFHKRSSLVAIVFGFLGVSATSLFVLLKSQGELALFEEIISCLIMLFGKFRVDVINLILFDLLSSNFDQLVLDCWLSVLQHRLLVVLEGFSKVTLQVENLSSSGVKFGFFGEIILMSFFHDLECIVNCLKSLGYINKALRCRIAWARWRRLPYCCSREALSWGRWLYRRRLGLPRSSSSCSVRFLRVCVLRYRCVFLLPF